MNDIKLKKKRKKKQKKKFEIFEKERKQRKKYLKNCQVSFLREEWEKIKLQKIVYFK